MLLHRRSLSISPRATTSCCFVERGTARVKHLAQEHKVNYKTQGLHVDLWEQLCQSLNIRTLCFPLFAVVVLTCNNCSCKAHELGSLFHDVPVHTCTLGLGEVDNTAFKPSGHPTSNHPWHCYSSLDRGRQYIRGTIPAFSLLTFTTQHDDDHPIARLTVYSSEMIRIRINDST